tara:strand:- start:287 stop:478 length:192 start_codon:yes stop_codon:yes gene_type:complete
MENLERMLAEMHQVLIGTAVDYDKFGSGNKSAGTRLRKAMQEIKHLAQDVRTEVQEIKNGELV